MKVQWSKKDRTREDVVVTSIIVCLVLLGIVLGYRLSEFIQ